MEPPILVIATDNNYFNTMPFEQEGYITTHIPHATQRDLEDAADSIEPHLKYAIIAFGTAATHALSLATSSIHSLACVIAYYPPTLPPSFKVHSTIQALIHLPMATPFSPASKPPHVLIRSYQSPPGFAESSSPAYDANASSIAYTRTLELLRRTIGPIVDNDDVWERHLIAQFVERDADKALSTMIDEPYVTHVPTGAGGIGYKELHAFYTEHFIPRNPPSLRMKPLSRTVGAERVVDELIATFRHDQVVDWMLPGVPPTGKEVEVALVVVARLRGGKLVSEHIYWDQATVLVQIGLLDPKLLPVMGAESARKVRDKDSLKNNLLIPEWKAPK
ncbi:hypothetical protein DFP73DRAFT_517048 [Morchella snyderi]|nr:hypothetical protein DFP73DRAFT_517048 [Morchella snyderi]